MAEMIVELHYYQMQVNAETYAKEGEFFVFYDASGRRVESVRYNEVVGVRTKEGLVLTPMSAGKLTHSGGAALPTEPENREAIQEPHAYQRENSTKPVSQHSRMKLCPQCNAKSLNTATTCNCGYLFQEEPRARTSVVEQETHSIQTGPGRTLQKAANEHDYLEINWDRVLLIWWGLIWRTMVFGTLVSAALSFCAGFLVGVAGHPELGTAVGLLIGWLSSIPVSIVLLRVVLNKKFSEFSIRLVKNG